MPTSVADPRPPVPMGAPRTPRAHPAAASTLAPAWLHGPPTVGRVVGVFGSSAAYLLRDDEVLPVLAPGALVLPGGLRVAHPVHLHDLALRVGDEVVVGGGEVLSRGAGLVVRRTWRPSPVPTRELPGEGAARALAAALDETPGLTDDLPRDLVRSAAAAAPSARRAAWSAEDLVGRGPGLTPAGDDVLCGMLLGLRAGGLEVDRTRLAGALDPLLGRTTALSASLLRQAAAGYAVPALVELLTAWHRDPRPTHLAGLTAEVATIGHTSGRALLLGLRVVLAGCRGGAPRHTHEKRGPS